MSQPVRTMQADVVIAGSGPGGATMAREMSKKGKKVILCEAGRYQKFVGNSSVFLLGMMDGLGFTFSKEGTWVLRPKTAGGASVVFCGTAWPPPPREPPAPRPRRHRSGSCRAAPASARAAA